MTKLTLSLSLLSLALFFANTAKEEIGADAVQFEKQSSQEVGVVCLREA